MIWIAVRVVLVASAVLSGPGVARWYPDQTSLRFLTGLLAVTALLGGLTTAFLLSITRVAMRPGERWQRPAWHTRFSFRDAGQIIHLLAWYATAGGVSAVLFAFLIPDSSLEGGIGIAGLGVGMLAGLHACVRLYRRAFTDP